MASVLNQHEVCPPSVDELSRVVVYDGPPHRFGNNVLTFLGTSRSEIDQKVQGVRDLGEATVKEAMYQASQALVTAEHLGVRALSLFLG